MKPPDWVLPHPDNESLTLVRAVLPRHPDSSQTSFSFSGTGSNLTLALIITTSNFVNSTHFSLWEKPPELVWDTTTSLFRLLHEGLGLALLQLAVPVAAAGVLVQAQEILGHLHLLDVSDGVVSLSEQH